MADSVVVADNVELVANNIQNKVGSTLIGLKSVAKQTSEKVSEPSIGILDNIRTFQQATVDKVQSVWDVLKEQLDFTKDQDRRYREQLKPGQQPGLRGGPPAGLENAVSANKGSSGFWDGIKGGIAASLLTMGGLRRFIGKIFKGAFWGMLGAMAGSALVKKMQLEGSGAEDAIMTTLPTVAALAAMFNVKKALLLALPIVAALGLKSMVGWLTGDKLASEISTFDWASVAITGPAAIALATAFGAKFTLAGGLTLGTAIIGMPVLIAASIAIALAAGVGFLNSKISGIEQTMLEHLDESTDLTQAEFTRRLNEQRGEYIANLSPGLAKLFGKDLTMGQELLLASEAAKDKSKLEGPKGDFQSHEVNAVIKSIDKMTDMDDATLQNQLDDKHKADELLKFIHNMYIVVQSGKLGEQETARLFKKLTSFSQNIQMTAKSMYAQKEDKGLTKFGMGEGYLQDISESTGYNDRGDYVENYAKFKTKIKPLEDKRMSMLENEDFKRLSNMKTVDMSKDEKKWFKDKESELMWLEKDIADKYNNWVWMYSGQGPDKSSGVDIAKMLNSLPEDVQQKIIANSLSNARINLKSNKALKPDNVKSEGHTITTVSAPSANNQSNSFLNSTTYTSSSVDRTIEHALGDNKYRFFNSDE